MPPKSAWPWIARSKTFGAIDILVNSAGVLIPDNVESMDPADLERMMAVNLYGTVHAMQAVLPSMRVRSRGNIVNIASLAGRRGLPPLGGYCATKFAVVGLTEALRVELYGSGITASLIMPGVIDTPMVRESNSKKARAARQHYCDAAAMGNVGGDRGGRAGSSRG